MATCLYLVPTGHPVILLCFACLARTFSRPGLVWPQPVWLCCAVLLWLQHICRRSSVQLPGPHHSTAPHTTTLHTTTARHTHQSHGSDNNRSTNSDKSLSAKNEKSVKMSSENFCLKWNDHHSVFFSNAEKLCHGSLLTDVVISAGGTLFQAHKLVLSVCSKFFQVFFTRSQVYS